jgi:PAS domain S-box-containing protein
MSKSLMVRVKEIEKQNRLLTDNLVDAVWVVDAKTLIYDYITSSIVNISGYTAEELINTTIADRLTPESLQKCTTLLKQGLQQYEQGQRFTQSLELEMVHKKGDTYWVEIRVKLLEEADRTLKLVGITRDITMKKRVELQLEDQNRKLAEALADKEKLLEEIRVLQELLPICSSCKRIRDDKGKWWPLDAYIQKHTNSDITHSICPDCKEVLYADLDG